MFTKGTIAQAKTLQMLFAGLVATNAAIIKLYYDTQDPEFILATHHKLSSAVERTNYFAEAEGKRQMKGVSQLLRSQNGIAILDGGLGTVMESHGADLKKELWQANFIRDDPELILKSHREQYEGGADIVVAASYQANSDLFQKKFNFTKEEADDLIARSVYLANDAREQVLTQDHSREMLVAASIGPYGAHEASTNEQNGKYGEELGEDFLMEWHRNRFEVICDKTNADVIAIESIPCLTEIRAILRLLRTRPDARVWITMTVENGAYTKSGESFDEFIEIIERLDKLGQVEAIGMSCSSHNFVPEVIRKIRHQTSRPIIVYPNQEEILNPDRVFIPRAPHMTEDFKKNQQSLTSEAEYWKETGAPIIIGGCSLDKDTIKQMSETLRDKDKI